MNDNRLKVSVCIPVYNGEKTIEALVVETSAELSPHYDLEVILVNDFSQDNSANVCRRIAENNDFVKYIGLRKNFGEHNAVMCALNYAVGDYVVVIDDDFQNPPSEIRVLVEEARQGYDVVYSRYGKKRDAGFRNLGSAFNDKVANWLLEKPKDLYLSSFKTMSANLVSRIVTYKGPSPYIDGLILRETRNISAVDVKHDGRMEGESNYTLARLLTLWLNMFVNFSLKPLRLFTLFGMVVTVFASISAVIFVIQKLVNPDDQLGWTSIMVGILFFSGVQIVFLGLIGEYIGKNYLQSSGTPQWSIAEESL